MSIEIIQKDRKLESGWINVAGQSWYSIGVLPSPKAKSIHGIAFTSIEQIQEAIKVLKYAERKLKNWQKANE